MSQKNIFAAIDVGTTKTVAVLATVKDNYTMRVLGVGVSATRGVQKGIVVNIDEAKVAIKEAVRKAEHSSGMKIESAYVGVTGRHVNSLNNRSAVAISRSDKLVAHDDLDRVMSAAKSIEVAGDRQLLHVIPRQFILDGNVGVKNPIGLHGFRLDVDAHIITAAATAVQNVVKCIRAINIEVVDLVLEPLASAEACLRADEKDAGVILADIGGGTTDISVFKDGSIWHTSVLPVGGYQVTRDIAIGLGIPFNVAEELKKKHANLNYRTIKENEGIENTGLGIGDGQTILRNDMDEIIRARIEEIIRLIPMELPPSDYSSLIPAGLVLTGGSSNIPGIEILAQEILNMPVRVGAPTGMAGLSDILYDPAYSTVVGLLLWGVNHSKDETKQPRPFARTRTAVIARKVLSPIRRLLNK
ncbi:MAG: cell division protein FtsA [Dehalococcoidia bacterium]|nr:cell division protein FtsA [Dehalococcoidia bacterium]